MHKICSDGKKREFVEISCGFCHKPIWIDKRRIKPNRINYCNKDCRAATGNFTAKCSYCGIEFIRKKSSPSKTGLYFCCRNHKDKAQKCGSGIPIQPNYYINGYSNYRDRAIEHYGGKCEICGYNEYLLVLDVHHIDENRDNGNLENLIVLCPNHHVLLTRNIAKLINRKLVFGEVV